MQRNSYHQILLMIGATLCAGCQAAIAPPAQASTSPPGLHIKAETLSFIHPGTGHSFILHLGEELIRDTGGATNVLPQVKGSIRDATSSYYEPTDQNGCHYASAESLYSHDQASLIASNTNVQYEADTQRLLITEDKSDGRPCRRYILYTRRNAGYQVTYLSPVQKVAPKGVLPGPPPDIKLLPNDRAMIGGKIFKIDDISQSTHPFSVGG